MLEAYASAAICTLGGYGQGSFWALGKTNSKAGTGGSRDGAGERLWVLSSDTRDPRYGNALRKLMLEPHPNGSPLEPLEIGSSSTFLHFGWPT